MGKTDRYISVEDIGTVCHLHDEGDIEIFEVVRCKNCRYFNKYGFKLEYTECTHFDCDVSEDGYCAWGETRDE